MNRRMRNEIKGVNNVAPINEAMATNQARGNRSPIKLLRGKNGCLMAYAGNITALDPAPSRGASGNISESRSRHAVKLRM